MADERDTWSSVSDKILLAMKDLTGIEFQCMKFQSGNFHVCAFFGDSKCFFSQVNFGMFGQTVDRSLEVAETEMADCLKRGATVFTTEFVGFSKIRDVWLIPPFSTVEELYIKARIVGGEDPFRTAT